MRSAMTKPPSLSIVTITYNNEEGLKRTAQSVNAQSNKNYEWIIIDGASNDGTKNQLHNLTADVIVSEPDNGIYDAMNKGIQNITANYVIFLNAGDQFASEHIISTLEQHIKDQQPDFIYTDAIEWSQQNDIKIIKPARHHQKSNYGMFTHHQAMIYKTSIIREHNLKYDTQIKIASDYKFTLAFLKHCHNSNILYIPDAPICIFEHGGVSQTQSTLGRKEQFKIRKEQKNCSYLVNTFIYFAQLVSWNCAQNTPTFYNWLKGKKQLH